MITRMRIRNFKSFGPDSDWFPLGKLTLILGANASGKSTILQALLLLAQSWRQPLGFAELLPDGDLLQVGHMWHLSHNRRGEAMSFAFEFDHNAVVEVQYSVSSSDNEPNGKLRSMTFSRLATDGTSRVEWDWTVVAAGTTTRSVEFVLVDSASRIAEIGNPLAQRIAEKWNAYKETHGDQIGREVGSAVVEINGQQITLPPWRRVLNLVMSIDAGGPSIYLDSPGDSDLSDEAGLISARYYDSNRYECGEDTIADSFDVSPELKVAVHELHDIFDAFLGPFGALRDALAEIAHVGPSRIPGLRLYPQRSSSRAPNWVGTDGCNTAAVLDALGPSAIDRLNGLLKRQNVPYRLRLERVGEPVLARLLRLTHTASGSNSGGTDFEVDVCDVGYGVSQVLPIIVQLLSHQMRERPSIGGSKSRGGTKDAGTCDAAQRGDQLVTRPLLIEQPELHLHPAWQADITSMLLDVWPTGNLDVDESPESKAEVQGIVETHSETMVLRVARLIRNGQLAAARPGERREFQILAVGQAPNKPGTTEVRAVNIDEDGWFDRQQFFEGFFADRVDEELG